VSTLSILGHLLLHPAMAMAMAMAMLNAPLRRSIGSVAALVERLQ